MPFPSPFRARRRAAMALACGLLWPVLAVQAQTPAWPSKSLRLVVPFPAGGATDVVARVVAQNVAVALGQSVVVDNRTGAGGTIGAAEVAKAPADGYTLLLTTTSTHAISPHLMPRLAYDPVRDFTPIAHLADAPNVLLVTAGLPVKSVAELISYAKAHPRQLNYASSGNGTIVHLNGAEFAARAGMELTHVPYKGTGQSITDLAAGQVHVLFDSIVTAMPQARAGRVRALAVTSGQRSPLAPELPTVAESGLPGFTAVTWFGLYGPARLPAPLVARIHQAFAQAVQAPAVVQAMAQVGAVPASGSPAAFAAMVAADSQRWAQVIREQKISLE